MSRSPACDVTNFDKGAQNPQLSFRIFPKISETLKAHISGTERDINKQQKLSFQFLTFFHTVANKKIIKTFDA